MAVGRCKGGLPGWLGENGAYATAGRRKSATARDGCSRVIPTHFRNVSQRRTYVVGPTSRGAPIWRISGGVASGYGGGRVSGEFGASDRGNFRNAARASTASPWVRWWAV